MRYDVSLFVQIYFGNVNFCQSNNIMHYILFETVQTYITFNRVTSQTIS